MYVITKEFAFSAAHQLVGLPESHPCSRLHGHNYRVIVELASDHLKAEGWVEDYGELDGFKKWIDEHLDHRNINDVLGFHTTAENIAEYLFGQIRAMGPWEVTAVSVSETPKTWAWYRP